MVNHLRAVSDYRFSLRRGTCLCCGTPLMAALSMVTAPTTEAAVSKAAGRPAPRPKFVADGSRKRVTEGLQDALSTNLSGGCASEDGGHGLTTNVAVRFDRSRSPPIQAAEIEGPGADRWGARGC